MPGFVFSLERVLDLRALEEEEARIELARQEAVLKDLEGEKIRLQEELGSIGQTLSQTGHMTGPELWLWKEYRERILHEIEEVKMRFREQQKKVAEQRLLLLERTKERKKLEKLKDKQRKEFEEEQRLKEQKELDETATLRFRRFDM